MRYALLTLILIGCVPTPAFYTCGSRDTTFTQWPNVTGGFTPVEIEHCRDPGFRPIR